jgi:hypothetical protein
LLSVDRVATVGTRIGRAILRQDTNLWRIHRSRQSLRLLIDDLRLLLIYNGWAAELLVSPQTGHTS